MKFYVTFLINSIFLAIFPVNANWGQNAVKIEANPIEITKAIISKKSTAGLHQLQIHFKIVDGHKAYLERFKLFSKDKKSEVVEFYASPVIDFNDPITKTTKEGVKGAATIQATVKIKNLSSTYDFDFGYQICTEKLCYLPQTTTIHAKKQSLTSPSLSLEEMFKKSLWLALLGVFFAGVLTSFTPCVFPIIPLTISALGSGQESRSHIKGFLLSLTYVLGMALTYSALGLFAASTGALFGGLLGHPIVVGALAFIFIAMALSSFGHFEIKAPDTLANKFTNKKTGSGFIGALLMGILAGVVAGPCVGPILVSILTYVAKEQNLMTGFLLLFTYAIGMGQLFIVIGTFSQLTKKLPRSGSWMKFINFIFGTFMLGMAIFILNPLLNELWTNSLVALAFIFSSWQLGIFNFSKSQNMFEKFKKVLSATLFILGVSFFAYNFHTNWFQNNNQNEAPANNPYKVKWHKYSEQLIEKAKVEQKPIILDFYADWCAACDELDHKTFSTKEVQELTSNFYWVKFDATSNSDDFKKLRDTYSIVGLPHVVFIDQNGEWQKDLTLTGFEDKDSFIKRLENLK